MFLFTDSFNLRLSDFVRSFRNCCKTVDIMLFLFPEKKKKLFAETDIISFPESKLSQIPKLPSAICDVN